MAEAGGTVVLTQVLVGMGGVGKTQLAAAYARQAWKQGVGVLVWVNAATRDGIISAYADTALVLGLPLADRHDPDRSAQAFLAWAESTTDSWWLVVLDDVRDPADASGLWPPAAESAAGGQVLVTTRLRSVALNRVDSHTVQVDTFTPSEARAYFLAKLGDRVLDATHADDLAEDLGHLPLALAQAAAYIANEDITVQRYRDLLATKLLKEVVPEQRDLTDDHQRIVAATWELSIDHADAARPRGMARLVLQMASMLDSAGIPQAVLSSASALKYLASNIHDSEHEGQTISPEMVDGALRVLHRYSLVDHDRREAHREVRVHQLVQRATRENLSTRAPLGRDLFTQLAQATADSLLEVWPQAERDLGQIMRANTATLQRAAGNTLCSPENGAHGVLFQTIESLGGTGQVYSTISAYTALRSDCQIKLGLDHFDTLAARANLARWLGRSGDTVAAVTEFEQVLSDSRRVFGSDHLSTLTARANLARWRGAAGNPTGAALELKELLPDCLRLMGPDHPDTLTVRHELAYWSGEAGDAVGAAVAFEQVLADRQRLLGPDHPRTLTAALNLAHSRGMAGDPLEAGVMLEQLLADYLRVLGPDHPSTLIVRHEQAYWRGRAGDAAGAAVAFERLLADRLRILGPDHPDTLLARANLAQWQGRAGDPAQAAASLEHVLSDQVRILGRDHPDTQKVLSSLEYWRQRLASNELRRFSISSCQIATAS